MNSIFPVRGPAATPVNLPRASVEPGELPFWFRPPFHEAAKPRREWPRRKAVTLTVPRCWCRKLSTPPFSGRCAAALAHGTTECRAAARNRRSAAHRAACARRPSCRSWSALAASSSDSEVWVGGLWLTPNPPLLRMNRALTSQQAPQRCPPAWRWCRGRRRWWCR